MFEEAIKKKHCTIKEAIDVGIKYFFKKKKDIY